MPSLPTSLIVVGLVAAWLVVLVPMVAKRREHVPESDEDSAGFRVLRRASRSLRRRPVLSRTAVTDAEIRDPLRGRPDDEADARADHFEDDVDDDAEYDADEYSEAEYRGNEHRGDEYGGDEYSGDEVEYAAAQHDETDDDDAEYPERAVAEQDDDRWDEADADDARHRPDDYDTDDEWTQERRVSHRHRRAAQPARREPQWRAEPARDERWSAVDDRGRTHAEPPRYDEARYRPVPVRPGRGGFDARAAEQAKAYRYRQRRRVVLALLVLTVVGAALGVLGVALAWAGAAVGTVLLALYLAYLRRQVRIEETIRQRRAARQERARQIRPVYRASVAEQVRAHRSGSLARPAAGDEPVETYRVRSHARPTVPPAFHTRGVPVDLDDDDPAFDDLEYYRPVTYRRAAGE